jgi:GrpB-like predicted nucleotidyltransferase (UPF0157 family)
MSLSSRLNRPIHVVDYDPNWPSLYEAEKESILTALGNRMIQIEHFGSTSVPGLPAKPVIDIAVGVESLQQAQNYIPSLENLGYKYEPELEVDTPARYFLWKGTPLVHTYHISMEVPGSPSWAEHILFRDYLRQHPDEACRYQNLKQELAVRCVTDMEAYVSGKTAFVVSCLEKAKIEADARDKLQG